MRLKDLTLFALDADHTRAAIAAAGQAVKQFGVHLRAMAPVVLPSPQLAFAAGPSPTGWASLTAQARARGAARAQDVSDALSAHGISLTVETPEALPSEIADVCADAARTTDLSILARPGWRESASMEMIEGLLFNSGRPILIAPPGCDLTRSPQRVLAAWDNSREAARAIAECDLLAAPGAQIMVATVGPEAAGQASAQAMATHLTRRGFSALVHSADADGGGVAKTLNAMAEEFQADLIVMGGYRHARLAQRFFGGATVDMIHHAPTPLLMAH